MAVSSIEPRKAWDGKSIAKTLRDTIDYDKNPSKTDGGKLVTAFQCNPATADKEFIVAKQIYELTTGRKRTPDKDNISYFLLQSFKPDEITPELANKIGYDLAMEFTKGQHQFVVATHINKAHIHNHIEFNSTTLDCSRKFDNYWNTYEVVQEISDRLCRDNGLSVVENPGGKAKSYGEWSAEKRGRGWKAKLRSMIDETLPNCSTYDEFIEAMKVAGCKIKTRGNSLSMCLPDQTDSYTRVNRLGDDYTPDALRARIGKPRGSASSRTKQPDKSVNILIDIQAKMQAGKGAGYAHWAKIYNLKEMAKTLNYLTEHGITEYTVLEEKASKTAKEFDAVSSKIKHYEARMSEVAALKTHIINYAKTRDIYAQYKKSRHKEQFRTAHETELLLHEAAKRAFDAQKVKKLPTVASLNEDYSKLLESKKESYAQYTRLKKESRELAAAKINVDRILGISPPETERENSQEKER